MPTERFYRLPMEKQNAIRGAAMKEFARVPIDKVSINKIIQEADISRGSFYTYFEDKWDILEYLFEEGRRQMKRFCVEELERYNGDIWMMLEAFMGEMLKFCAQRDSFGLLKGVIQHMSPEQMFGSFIPKVEYHERKRNELERWCYERANKQDFRDPSYEGFHRMMMLIGPAMAMAVKAFYMGVPADEIKKEYSLKLRLLRYGVCREQGDERTEGKAPPKGSGEESEAVPATKTEAAPATEAETAPVTGPEAASATGLGTASATESNIASPEQKINIA